MEASDSSDPAVNRMDLSIRRFARSRRGCGRSLDAIKRPDGRLSKNKMLNRLEFGDTLIVGEN